MEAPVLAKSIIEPGNLLGILSLKSTRKFKDFSFLSGEEGLSIVCGQMLLGRLGIVLKWYLTRVILGDLAEAASGNLGLWS